MYLYSEMYVKDYYSDAGDLIDAISNIRCNRKMKLIEHGYCQASKKFYIEYKFLKE